MTKSTVKAAVSTAAPTDQAVNIQQHGFSGETCEIKLFKADASEPIQPFFGINGYSIVLHRDKWVTVPVEMADHIESLTSDVREFDPDFPEDYAKQIWVPRQRFALQRKD